MLNDSNPKLVIIPHPIVLFLFIDNKSLIINPLAVLPSCFPLVMFFLMDKKLAKHKMPIMQKSIDHEGHEIILKIKEIKLKN